jgi:hypothetical protein
MSTPTNELLDSKELAKQLKRHVSFVYAMRQRGFQMPGGRASIDEALRWLSNHIAPKSRFWGKSGLKGVNQG